MAKTKTVFICGNCGNRAPKWMGRCTACNEWNTFEEETVSVGTPGAKAGVKPKHGAVLLKDVTTASEARISTAIGELDRVLGGGLVHGSLTLVGGEPGIGKSTLLLQICNSLGKYGTVLYASGEESETQIKLRAARLSIDSGNLYLLSETSLDSILSVADNLNPRIIIIDSIQTVYQEELTGAPGSVSQIREATLKLMVLAKSRNISVFIVGHVTKEGAIAGPRVLEHMVDTVLYFEGERHNTYRVLRAVKNRFGGTNEIGVFEMDECGLVEIENPSAALIGERPKNTAGSSVLCTIEGTRPMLCEVQALTSASGFGIARRMASGIDINRVNMLIAVLEKKLSLNLGNQDVYVNIVGGIKVEDTAADLPIAFSVYSSFKNKSIPADIVFLGEVGLTGELRSVTNLEKRIKEIKKMGFKRIVVPKPSKQDMTKTAGLIPAASLSEAFSLVFSK